MALTVTDDRMDSDVTTHVASRPPDGEYPEQDTWMVSWMPTATLNRSEATTAMILAETLADPAVQPGHRKWPHVRSWAAELGMTPEQVVAALRPNT